MMKKMMLMVLILVTNFLSPPQVICVAENEETGGTGPRLHLALVLSFVIFILVAIIEIIFGEVFAKMFLGIVLMEGKGLPKSFSQTQKPIY